MMRDLKHQLQPARFWTHILCLLSLSLSAMLTKAETLSAEIVINYKNNHGFSSTVLIQPQETIRLSSNLLNTDKDPISVDLSLIEFNQSSKNALFEISIMDPVVEANHHLKMSINAPLGEAAEVSSTSDCSDAKADGLCIGVKGFRVLAAPAKKIH